MPQTPPASKTTADANIKVHVERGVSAEASVGLTYGCPSQPDQCTALLGTVTTTAQARLRASLAATTVVGCELAISVHASLATPGPVVVSATGSSGVSVTGGPLSFTNIPANGIVQGVIPFGISASPGTTVQLTITTTLGNQSKAITMDVRLTP